ncbi:GntR family transcriptional regulator, partial [Oleiphilus sp. HI0123]
MKQPIYKLLANDLAEQIRQSTFARGDKLPSVRELAKQRSVSVSTVLMSYGLL